MAFEVPITIRPDCTPPNPYRTGAESRPKGDSLTTGQERSVKRSGQKSNSLAVVHEVFEPGDFFHIIDTQGEQFGVGCAP